MQHADKQSNINTDSANTLTTAGYNTSTVITLNNFYDQRELTPRNNKRRIIRMTGTSNCLHQLSIHFRKMYSSSWGSVHRPWVHQTMMMIYQLAGGRRTK